MFLLYHFALNYHSCGSAIQPNNQTKLKRAVHVAYPTRLPLFDCFRIIRVPMPCYIFLILFAQAQMADPGSMLNLYKSLARIRQYPGFQTSHLKYSVTNDNVVSYVREARGWTKHLVVLNFGTTGSTDDYSKSPVDSTSGTILATTNNMNSSDIKTGKTISLKSITLYPGQGLVLAVKYQSTRLKQS